MKRWIAVCATLLACPFMSNTVNATCVQWTVNAHCYEARLVPGGITWQDAQNQCVSDGGYLATITSAEENTFVFGLVSGDNSFWFIDGAGNGQGPWLGASQPPGSPEPAGGWQWVTGEAWGFTAWEQDEPNDFQGTEHCLQFFKKGGLIGDRWNDVDGSGLKPGYIYETSSTVAVTGSTWENVKVLFR